MMFPLHATGYQKGQCVLAALAVLCCILLAGSHTKAGTHPSKHLPLDLFNSLLSELEMEKRTNIICT